MGTNSNIEYVNHTLNFWRGCHKVSAGCENCYMYREQTRYGLDPTEVVRTTWKTWANHTKWKSGSLVFVCSWSDFFIEDADPWRKDAWDIIRERSDLIWIIVTKRPYRINECLPPDWGEGWPNVWLIVTAENQDMLNYRVSQLFLINAAVRGVSAEPLLSALDFGAIKDNGQKLDWVIAGGESGNKARPMHPEWALDIKDYCRLKQIPFFFKQWGRWRPINYKKRSEVGIRTGDICLSYDGTVDIWKGKRQVCFANESEGIQMRALGKKKTGRVLAGVTYSEYPTII